MAVARTRRVYATTMVAGLTARTCFVADSTASAVVRGDSCPPGSAASSSGPNHASRLGVPQNAGAFAFFTFGAGSAPHTAGMAPHQALPFALVAALPLPAARRVRASQARAAGRSTPASAHTAARAAAQPGLSSAAPAPARTVARRRLRGSQREARETVCRATENSAQGSTLQEAYKKLQVCVYYFSCP